jgi:fucose permease
LSPSAARSKQVQSQCNTASSLCFTAPAKAALVAILTACYKDCLHPQLAVTFLPVLLVAVAAFIDRKKIGVKLFNFNNIPTPFEV